MARTDLSYPMYFAEKPLKGLRVSYRKGDAFEIQTKDYVRALGPQYGVPDAATLPFSELPYVRIVNVRSRGMAEQVRQQAMTADAAAKLVGEDATHA